jgi:hypothetical protein
MGRPDRVQGFTPETNSYDDLVRGLLYLIMSVD